MTRTDKTLEALHIEINKAMRARERAASRRQTEKRDALDRTIEDLICRLDSFEF